MRCILLCLLLAGCTTARTSVVAAPASPAQAQAFERLRAFLNDLARHNRWQGSVALTRGRQLLFTHATGTLEPGNETKVDAQTRFRIGSITKTYTATLIFMLIEEGKLALDTPLSRFFPEIPNAQDIHIDHLLAHRSGIFSFTSAPDYVEWMTQPTSAARMLERIAGYEPVFAPGEKAEYSNSAYVLLGLISEKVTGRAYADVVRERIVDVVGARLTAVGDAIDTSANQVRSVLWNGAGWETAPQTHMSVPGAAGALMSTPIELCAFAQALFAGRLVSKASLAKMQEVTDGFGRGLFTFPFHGRAAWGHSGGIDGFRSFFGYFPDDDVCVATTSHALNYDDNQVSLAALSILYDKPFEFPALKTVTLSAQELARYAGTYASDDLPLQITLTQKGGVLWGQATGQPSFPLTAQSATEFVFDAMKLRIVFDAPGAQVPRFTLHQDGTYRFVRADSAAAARK